MAVASRCTMVVESPSAVGRLLSSRNGTSVPSARRRTRYSRPQSRSVRCGRLVRTSAPLRSFTGYRWRTQERPGRHGVSRHHHRSRPGAAVGEPSGDEDQDGAAGAPDQLRRTWRPSASKHQSVRSRNQTPLIQRRHSCPRRTAANAVAQTRTPTPSHCAISNSVTSDHNRQGAVGRRPRRPVLRVRERSTEPSRREPTPPKRSSIASPTSLGRPAFAPRRAGASILSYSCSANVRCADAAAKSPVSVASLPRYWAMTPIDTPPGEVTCRAKGSSLVKRSRPASSWPVATAAADEVAQIGEAQVGMDGELESPGFLHVEQGRCLVDMAGLAELASCERSEERRAGLTFECVEDPANQVHLFVCSIKIVGERTRLADVGEERIGLPAVIPEPSASSARSSASASWPCRIKWHTR